MMLNRKEVSPVRLFVGLDVSFFDMRVCFLDGEGKQLDTFAASNDLPDQGAPVGSP